MKLRSLYISFFIFLLCSCQLNNNSIPENGSNEILASELLKSSISQMAVNHSGVASRTAATLVQYYGEFDTKVNTSQGYLFSPLFFDNLWSGGFYAGSLVNIREMRDLARAESNEMLEAIAMILEAHEFANVTLMFGDVPYTESILGSRNITPSYDTQEYILNQLVNLIDSAIEKLLEAPAMTESLNNSDLIYGGGKELWRKFAYGLKARLLLNQSNKDNVDLDELKLSLDRSFQFRDEEAQFQFTDQQPNPHFSFATQRPKSFYIADHFYELMLNTSDPRMSYVSWQVGFDYIYFELNNFEPVHYRQTTSMPFMSHTEILFMHVEVSYLMNKNINEVQDLLKSAVLSSMEDHEIDITNDIELFASSISELSSLTDIQKHKRIIEQAYIAYYGFNHLQSWSNFRRTRYPEMESTATNPTELNPSNSIPERFLYPQTEYQYNNGNVLEAISRQDGALLDSEMWIFN